MNNSGLSKLEQLLEPLPRIMPPQYSPPAFPYGEVDGEPYYLTWNGKSYPYIEIVPQLQGGD